MDSDACSQPCANKNFPLSTSKTLFHPNSDSGKSNSAGSFVPVPGEQGDQIGRIFAHWVLFSLAK
jgi:hypothetical protein